MPIGSSALMLLPGLSPIRRQCVLPTGSGAAGSGQQTFGPALLGGLVAWFAADAVGHVWQDQARTVPAVADGDPVGVWDDLSSLGSNAVQATAGFRPLLRTNLLNGRPVLRFDGLDDYLRTAAWAAALVQPYTVVLVARDAVPATSSAFWATENAAIGTTYRAVGGFYRLFAGSNLISTTGVDAVTHVQTQVVTTSSTLWLDGVSIAAGAAGANTLSGLTLAGSSAATPVTYLSGDITEVLVYNRALLTGERVDLEHYLGSKYGLTVA